MEDTLSTNKKLCECGCGEFIGVFNKFKKGHNIRRIRPYPEYTSDEIVTCRICKSDKTFLRKRKKANGETYLKPDWYNVDRENKLAVCSNCYNMKINSEYYKHKYKSKIKYKGRYIYLKHEPRVGVCNWCRKVAPFDTPYTELHHDERMYNDSNPLENTIELCKTCHQKEKYRLGELSRRRSLSPAPLAI